MFINIVSVFFQGHLIIPKEGIENARVDPGGSE
jgi:hypothetical protein